MWNWTKVDLRDGGSNEATERRAKEYINGFNHLTIKKQYKRTVLKVIKQESRAILEKLKTLIPEIRNLEKSLKQLQIDEELEGQSLQTFEDCNRYNLFKDIMALEYWGRWVDMRRIKMQTNEALWAVSSWACSN